MYVMRRVCFGTGRKGALGEAVWKQWEKEGGATWGGVRRRDKEAAGWLVRREVCLRRGRVHMFQLLLGLMSPCIWNEIHSRGGCET